MNEMSNMPVSDARPEGPLQIWSRALTKPNEQTYAAIAASPNARASTAYMWVFVASLIQSFLIGLVQSRVASTYMQQYGVGGNFGNSGIGSTLVSAICGAPILAALTTLFFALGVFVIQWLARMFGGRGTSDQLAYTLASILAPFSIVAGIISLSSAIPYVGLCFSVILLIAGIYVFVLEVLAVKAVNQISTGAAIGSLLIPGFVIAFLCACLVGGLFALVVPALQNASPNLAP